MAFGTLGGILTIIGLVLVGAIALGLLVFYSIRIVQLLIKLVGHVVGTIARWIGDIFRLIGALVVALIFIPLIIINILIGRWSASSHFGRAFTDECKTMGACVYRILIGRPLHLIGLRGVTEGLEQRLPVAFAAAPGADKPSRKRQGMFEGYTIVGSLQGGGSGGKLYVAEPDDIKRAAYERRGHHNVDRVVIKTFSLDDGSSLPQIVRESRALDAAKKLGLVLEHDLSSERFYYIMRYVPGDSLTVATQQLHARADASGLSGSGIRLAVGYTADLLEALDVYHRGGLWHKDVKPDNLIVDREPDPVLGRGKAHLVDFGLITPLRSAMTLTTHGTEYFRDPELVRQALRGVKVHQIDGGKFDVYAAGAVLFSIIENSFPAHGGLSQVSKKCPESIRWIIRRAMTDYDKRYPTARAMLEDLAVVAAAADPFTVKPADLPSMKGNAAQHDHEPIAAHAHAAPNAEAKFEAEAGDRDHSVFAASPASPVPPAAAFAAAQPEQLPKLRVSDWWTGRYTPEAEKQARPNAEREARRSPVPGKPAAGGAAPVGFPMDMGNVMHNAAPRQARTITPVDDRVSAKEQLKNAKRRATERRARAAARKGRAGQAALGPTARAGRRKKDHAPAAINAGIIIAVLFVISAVIGATAMLVLPAGRTTTSVTAITDEHGNTTVITKGNQAIATHSPMAPAAPMAPMPEMQPMGQLPAMLDMQTKASNDTTNDARASSRDTLAKLVPGLAAPLDHPGLALLTDFRAPLQPELIEDLRAAEEQLHRAGIHAATSLFSADLSDAQADTLAMLLASRGRATLDTELGVQISALIADRDGLDAVWWIGKGDDQPYRYLLATADEVSIFETDTPRIRDVVSAFVNTQTP